MSLVFQIVFYVFTAAVIVQLFYWLFWFLRLAIFQKEESGDTDIYNALSVIICAKNEYENLKTYLPLILEQEYNGTWEVLVVNDQSTDDSAQLLEELQQKYAHLRVATTEGKVRTMQGKKFALSVGIALASHDTLVLTDADCYPASPDWLYTMQSHINPYKTVALGYSPYEKRSGLLNLFIRHETVYTAIQYLSFAVWGMPYMGVGRNLTYRKQLYTAAGGFSSHGDLASGDDDLFINEAADGEHVSVVFSPKTHMISEPKTTLKGYIRQKQRHMSTATRYQLKHVLMLGALSASHFLTYLLFVPLLFYPELRIYAIELFLLRLLAAWFVYSVTALRLNDKWLMILYPMHDLFFILYYLAFAPSVFARQRTQWD